MYTDESPPPVWYWGGGSLFFPLCWTKEHFSSSSTELGSFFPTTIVETLSSVLLKLALVFFFGPMKLGSFSPFFYLHSTGKLTGVFAPFLE
jgi:hypothetical protein